MKKILTLISILAVMIFQGTTVFADVDKELLSALELLPEISCESERAVTRAEFAYTVARIMGSGELSPMQTKFSDVDESNIYSGYIAYLNGTGIISGTSETTFSPDDGLTPENAYAILVKCMGYNEYAVQAGGYPEGYRTLANQLGINKGIIVNDGFLTCKGMVGFISNALDVRYEPSEISKEKVTLLTHTLGINGYDAVVTDVNDENRTITVRIENNIYTTNKTFMAVGGVATYKCTGGININHYDSAPVRLYVDGEENVVAVLLQKNTEIIYSSIFSVNGDRNPANKYAPQYIQSICIDGDSKKYDMVAGAIVEFNEQPAAPSVAIPLIENFAKIILKDKEVIYIAAWELSEGGIINTVSEEEISYVRGSNANARIRDFDRHTKKLVFIDGESADMKQLKANTYFDWFSIAEDTVVIVASEKVITDVLDSYSSTTVNIGNAEYDTDSESFYMAEADGVYRSSRALRTLSGSTVTAYFDYADRCVYIKLYQKGSISSDKFLVVLDKFKYNEEDETETLYCWILEPSAELVSYPLAERVTYNDNLDLDLLKGRCRKLDGTGVYELTLNRKGEVSSFSSPTAPMGFTTSSGAITSVTNSENVYVNIGGKTIFLKQIDNMAAVYTEDSVFKVKTIPAETLKATTISGGATLRMYGDEDVLGIRMAVLCGAGLSTLRYSEYSYGVVSGKKTVVNEDNEIMHELSVTGKANTKLVLNETAGNAIPTNAFIIYNENAAFDDNGLIIHTVVDMTGDSGTWTQSGALHRDTVKDINDKMVMFSSGEAYFMNPTYSTCIEIDEAGVNEPEPIKPTDIDVGDTVYYYAGSEVRAILVVR